MKTVEFFQTTKGHTVEVNGVIVWFIRDEPRIKPNESWFVYKSEDGGKGFKLIPADITINKYGWNSLQAAKAFVYHTETAE